jgi:phosphatidylglycerophosphatase A
LRLATLTILINDLRKPGMTKNHESRVLTLADLKNPIVFLALGFGSGLAKKAPGTWGTLAALLPYGLLQMLAPAIYLAVIAVAFVAGIFICDYASKKIGGHDHGGIVWDEFVGFWITMILAPPGFLWIALGFVLFRLFDIWKPWPIGWVDKRVGGGFGIMLDDVLAGLWALVCMQLIAMLVMY